MLYGMSQSTGNIASALVITLNFIQILQLQFIVQRREKQQKRAKVTSGSLATTLLMMNEALKASNPRAHHSCPYIANKRHWRGK
jgi:hypothetical protein